MASRVLGRGRLKIPMSQGLEQMCSNAWHDSAWEMELEGM